MHHAPVRAVIIHGVMLGHTVVPERDVVLLPAPADGVLRAGAVGEQEFQNRFAFSL